MGASETTHGVVGVSDTTAVAVVGVAAGARVRLGGEWVVAVHRRAVPVAQHVVPEVPLQEAYGVHRNVVCAQLRVAGSEDGELDGTRRSAVSLRIVLGVALRVAAVIEVDEGHVRLGPVRGLREAALRGGLYRGCEAIQ